MGMCGLSRAPTGAVDSHPQLSGMVGTARGDGDVVHDHRSGGVSTAHPRGYFPVGDRTFRAWVGEAGSSQHPDEQDIGAWMTPPAGMSFAEGDVSFNERNLCSATDHRDLVLTDDQGQRHALPFGEQRTAGSTMMFHGGHGGTVNAESSITCESRLGPYYEWVRAGLLSCDYVNGEM